MTYVAGPRSEKKRKNSSVSRAGEIIAWEPRNGQFVGEMGVVENQPRNATVRAASKVKAEILKPTEFLDQIARSPPAARELILRLSQRLREAGSA